MSSDDEGSNDDVRKSNNTAFKVNKHFCIFCLPISCLFMQVSGVLERYSLEKFCSYGVRGGNGYLRNTRVYIRVSIGTEEGYTILQALMFGIEPIVSPTKDIIIRTHGTATWYRIYAQPLCPLRT
jgi:hypothetical protein